MDSVTKIKFLSERKYIMIIDNIVKLKVSNELRYNKLGASTLDDLTTFIFRGEYTNVKNKEYVLKYWLIHTPKQMSEKLDITVKGVYYLKKKINSQLIEELGADLLQLIYKENFYEVGNRVKLSQARLNTDSALPQYISNLVRKKVMQSNLRTPNESELKYRLISALDGSSTTNIFNREIAFMKYYRKVEINNHLNLLNPILLQYLMEISANKKDDLELRNMLFNYLNDSQ